MRSIHSQFHFPTRRFRHREHHRCRKPGVPYALQLKRNRRLLEESSWPLPDLDESRAIVLGTEPRHRMVLGYAAPALAAELSRWFIPERTPVFAVQRGIITEITEREDGLEITVDHRTGFKTVYGGLTDSPFRATPWCAHLLTQGQELGCVGASPCSDLRPLKFQVVRAFADEVPFPIAVDPAHFLSQWPHVPSKK